MPFDEDIALEIDALRSVYDDRELYINQTPSLEVEFIANPHIALGNEKSFVQATLHFRIPDGYPSIPPKIEIPSTRGLGEERKQRLLKSLSENAAEFCGDTSILTLCETARDLLDDINLPEGKGFDQGSCKGSAVSVMLRELCYLSRELNAINRMP